MHNNNSVELIDYMGSDKLHSLAAWASTFAEFDIPMPKEINLRVDQIVDHILNNGKRKRTIEELLTFLSSQQHFSPFRMSSFVFAMNTDIATHIQKLKHSVLLEAENGESARYKELAEDKFYMPDDWKDLPIEKDWYGILMHHTELSNELYHKCLADLTPVLGKKRAKETARYFKTYNSQINTVNKLSFDGVMQFYHKRHDKAFVQDEIADVAIMMVECIMNIPDNPFKYSLKAFGF